MSTFKAPFQNKSISKIAGTAVATLLAVTVISTSFITDANAGRRERLFLGGVAAGIVGTAIVAGEVRRSRERRHYRASRWERHVARCYRAYRSYDESTDTYIDYDGFERRCRK